MFEPKRNEWESERERGGERVVLITTPPRKLSHIRGEKKAHHRILKLNKTETFFKIMSKRSE